MSHTFYFERTEVWNLSRELVNKVYTASKRFPPDDKYGLTSQIRRASVSVSSNIAEGFSRRSYKEQARFTEISYGSLMEVLSQLILAFDQNFINSDQLQDIRHLIDKMSNKLNALKNTQRNRVEEEHKEYGVSRFLDSSIPRVDEFAVSLNPELISTESYFYHFTTIIDDDCKIGVGTKIWHFTHIMSGCTLGENCNLGQNVVVSPEVVLGNNVKVQNNVSIYSGVICEDDVFLGPSMVFTNVINPRSGVNRRGQYSKTVVRKGASIGANATIVCGNDIGKYAFIGAGAVVTKEVSAYALVVGNPAKQIGWMSEYGHRLHFNEAGKASCPESGGKYILKNDTVIKTEDS